MAQGSGQLEIPDTDVTSFVLEHAGERGDETAFVDGPSGRVVTYAELAEPGRGARRRPRRARVRQGRRPRRLSCRTSPSTRSPSTAPRRPAACARPSTRSTRPTSSPTSSRTRAPQMLLTVPPLPRGGARGGGAARVSTRSSWSARRKARAVRRAARRPGDAARGRDRPRGGPRGPALLERHDRSAQGRDAHPPQPRRQPLPDQAELIGLGDDDVLIGCLPFFHIYGMTVIMNLGPARRRDDRDHAALRPRAVPRRSSRATGSTRAYVVPPIALALAKHPSVDGHDLSSVRDHHVGRRAARRRAGRACVSERSRLPR